MGCGCGKKKTDPRREQAREAQRKRAEEYRAAREKVQKLAEKK